jgi:hypothetical protein
VSDDVRTLPARRGLSGLRDPRVVLPLLLAAPIPIAVALLVTARPVYPADACYYGAPQSSLLATDAYLRLMTPLGMFALALVAAIALPDRGRWRIIAPAVTAWALLALLWTDAARPVAIVGANEAVFGLFLSVPVLVIVAVIGKESSWIRAIGWFEFLFLVPLLLGLAGLLAQPGCYTGDPVAPIVH